MTDLEHRYQHEDAEASDPSSAERPWPGKKAAAGGNADSGSRRSHASRAERQAEAARRKRLVEEENQRREDEKAEKLMAACEAVAMGPQATPEKCGGIYVIVHVPTGRRYVGTTMNFCRRMGLHRTLLKGGRHHNVALQRDWSKFGSESFRYGLVAPFMTKLDAMRQYATERQVIKLSAEKSYNLISAEEARRTPSGELLIRRFLKLTAEEWASFDALGGAPWVRKQIDKAKG